MLADGAMLDIEATIELPPDADWPADCGVRAAIDGVRVGRAHFVHGGSGFDLWTTPISWEATGDPGVEVEPAHRRRGIATAMYRFAHRFLPGGIRPSGDLTDDGRAYWAKLWCDPIFGD
jgi:GNAT superfamily N-acetyltransferase